MQVYEVGGAVRDELLGLPVSDRDYVVVGATPAEMLAAGFKPVGRDFPVFLHPRTQEEYALARTERKHAPGYAGFTFHTAADVTLEDDLARRDLTINAMARTASGDIVDPFGGRADLERKLLRHVGPAFVEDPVRILRLARFAARFSDFSIAPETEALMAQMVDSGEADALVAERVWQECARGLMEAHPARMWQVLQRCGLFPRLFPELAHVSPANWAALEQSAARQRPLPVRAAVWLGEGVLELTAVRALALRLRMPAECADVAEMVARQRATVVQALGQALPLLALYEQSDALRRPERFLLLCAALIDLEVLDENAGAQLVRLLEVVRTVDAGAVARQAAPGTIPHAVRAARLEVLEEALTSGQP